MNMHLVLVLFCFLIALIVIGAMIALNIVISMMFRTIARQKGHYEARYFWIPFFFGFVGYILVAALPDRGVQNVVQVQPVMPAVPTTPVGTNYTNN